MTTETGTGRAWLVVQTKAGSEPDVVTRLHKRGFRVWYWHCFRDVAMSSKHRRTRREGRPYFSRYVFVADTRRIDVINDTAGVSTVVTMQGADAYGPGPLRIRDADLRALAAFLEVDVDGLVPEPRPEAVSTLPKGSTVRPVDGPFVGFLATVAKAVPLDGKARIRAFIDIFGRPTSVEFEQGQIEVL